MPMAHCLARLRPAGAEAHSVNDAVETPLERAEQILAGDALHFDGFLEGIAELRFEDAENAADLLFLAKLQAVTDKFRFAILAVLARNEVAALNCALVRVAALAFQE